MTRMADDPVLWRWQCPICTMQIRSRTSHITQREARQHSYTEHRTVPQLIVPVMCLWDSRILGHQLLVTYPD